MAATQYGVRSPCVLSHSCSSVEGSLGAAGLDVPDVVGILADGAVGGELRGAGAVQQQGVILWIQADHWLHHWYAAMRSACSLGHPQKSGLPMPNATVYTKDHQHSAHVHQCRAGMCCSMRDRQPVADHAKGLYASHVCVWCGVADV